MPIPAVFDLSGRAAVVTGAGSPEGIGFATARMLAELGAAVMITATTARIEDRVGELCTAGLTRLDSLRISPTPTRRLSSCQLRWSDGGDSTSWSTTLA